jgi:hypothetical protein
MKPNFKPKALCSAIALAGLGLTAGHAAAAEYWLRATSMSANVNGVVVPMWGYQDCTSYAGFASCPANTALWAPGRRLDVPVGDTTLTVHLQNDNLPEPTSLLIPGLRKVASAANPTPVAMTPQFFPSDDANYPNRMRSQDVEAAAGATQDYTWAAKPGTYLYTSGTHQQVQVQMGLYGMVSADATLTEAYPGVAKAADLTLLFSEVDAKLHADVANLNYGPGKPRSSTLYNMPSWFLVNGKPYVPGATPAISTNDAGGALSAATVTRVRLLNAGLHTHVPTFNNASVKLIAEDGKPGPFGAVEQYHVNLPPLKTVDALLTTAPAATVAIYDRHLSTTNPIQTTDSYGVPVQASVSGGMFAKLLMQGDLGPAPAAFTLSVQSALSGQASLGWTNNGDATSFKVYRGATLIAELGAAASGYVDTGLTANTTYDYTVVASNLGGSTTATASFTTPVGESLLAATGLAANFVGMNTTLANSSVILSFNDQSNGETGYKVEFCRGTASQCTAATTTLATETANLGLATANRWIPLPAANVAVNSPAGPGAASALLSGLSMTRAGYYFRVSPLGAASSGPSSNISSFMNLAATPAAPTGFGSATGGAAGTASLIWTDGANGNNSYQVQQRRLSGVYSIAFTSANTGYGYTVAPNVYVAPPTLPGGVQATAHAVLVTANVPGVGSRSGVVRIVVDNPGAGYTAAPAVTVSGGTRVGGRAYGPATVLRSNYTATGSGTWVSAYADSVVSPTPVPGNGTGTTVTGLGTAIAYQFRLRATGVTGTAASGWVTGSNSVIAP